MDGPALLDRLDAAIRELQAIRAEVAADAVGYMHITPNTDDLAPDNLIEISSAVQRFNRPADSLRYLCRKESCGVKVGGRWLASVPRMQRRLNGG